MALQGALQLAIIKEVQVMVMARETQAMNVVCLFSAQFLLRCRKIFVDKQ